MMHARSVRDLSCPAVLPPDRGNGGLKLVLGQEVFFVEDILGGVEIAAFG